MIYLCFSSRHIKMWHLQFLKCENLLFCFPCVSYSNKLRGLWRAPGQRDEHFSQFPDVLWTFLLLSCQNQGYFIGSLSIRNAVSWTAALMNISVQVQDVYVQLWIPLFRVGPYLNCITRHLRRLHRTSSVSSSIFNVMDIVQHKDLSHTERRQRRVWIFMKETSGISLITKVWLPWWNFTGGKTETGRTEDVTVRNVSELTTWGGGLYLWGSGVCVRGFHFCSPPPCKGENHKTSQTTDTCMTFVNVQLLIRG